MKLLILAGLIALIGVAALVVRHDSKAAPQPCPGSDPRTCQTYGDGRDQWLQDLTFGAGEGDRMTSQEGAASGPMVNEYVCNNQADDDYDGRADYPADTGCTSPQDDDESNGPPEPPAPPPPPPPPGAPPPPPPGHDQITITLADQGHPSSPHPTLRCVDDLYSGLDLARLPMYAYFTDHATVCDDAMSVINVTLCALKALAPANQAWYPVVCYAKTTIANFRQYTKISRRCRQTQTRFSWRGEAIVYVRDAWGRTGTGVHRSPMFPDTGTGAYCR